MPEHTEKVSKNNCKNQNRCRDPNPSKKYSSKTQFRTAKFGRSCNYEAWIWNRSSRAPLQNCIFTARRKKVYSSKPHKDIVQNHRDWSKCDGLFSMALFYGVWRRGNHPKSSLSSVGDVKTNCKTLFERHERHTNKRKESKKRKSLHLDRTHFWRLDCVRLTHSKDARAWKKCVKMLLVGLKVWAPFINFKVCP